MMKARRSQKRAILASLKWGEGWSRCSIYFVQDCSLVVHRAHYNPNLLTRACTTRLPVQVQGIKNNTKMENCLRSCRSLASSAKCSPCINGADTRITILVHPKPHIHVKSPLSRNISTRLKMCKVLLFKFMQRYAWDIVEETIAWDIPAKTQGGVTSRVYLANALNPNVTASNKESSFCTQ